MNWAEIGVTVAGQASDGEEALELCKQLMPDIIITDIRMPVISGLEFLSALKETGVNAKVIIISGYSDFEYAHSALRLGVFDYILKPVENSELFDIVKKCIRQIETDAYASKIIEEAKLQLKITNTIENNPDNKQRRIIEKAIVFIEQNYRDPITLTDVADQVMLNPAYFSKLFKDCAGEPFTKYLTRYRINKAVELMKDPTLKIYEIAAMAGYENAQYFMKVFKSIKGFSPNIYREKL
jgi:YesN/AraC family two-component response regulator